MWRSLLALGVGIWSWMALGGEGAAVTLDARQLAFVPSRQQPLVSVIDTASDTVVARIATEAVPYQVVLSTARNLLVTGSISDDTVRLFDLASLEKVGEVRLGHAPEHMQMSPNGDLVAIGNYYEDGLTLLHLDRPEAPVPVSGLYQPHNLSFSADGRWIYVANLGANQVSVVDAESGTLAREIGIDLTPEGTAEDAAPPPAGITDLTLTRDGRAFVVPAAASEIPVLDLDVGIQMTSLPVGADPWHGYPTADDGLLIVPSEAEPATISLLSTSLLEEVARLPGLPEMTGAYPAWFDSVAFVPSRATRLVLVVDLDRRQMADPIPLPSPPDVGAVTGDGAKLYLTLPETDQLAVIDTRTRRILRLIDDVGDQPSAVMLAGSRNFCN